MQFFVSIAKDTVTDADPKRKVAVLITRVFNSYLSEFLIITRRAKTTFEQRDWRGGKRDATERLSVYEKVLSQIAVQIEGILGRDATDRQTWIAIKRIFAPLIAGIQNEDIAETFFNSVTRTLLKTVGIDREVEFFHLETRPPVAGPGPPLYRKFEDHRPTVELIRAIVADHQLNARYEDLDRDIELAANEVDLMTWPFVRSGNRYSVEILTPCFYRNKVAYIVGRILLGSRIVPMIIPCCNDDSGIHVDSVLLDEADANNVFGFAYSYFHVEVQVPSDLVAFLRTIMPHKPVADLYNALGFNRHGKTEFYRDLHRFVHVSKKQFVTAPGREGAVMTVFTLPNYNYVFKVIKDQPCFLRSASITDKTIDKTEVKQRYKFVTHRDRVGRLVDTQEFENVRFKAKRYSEQVLHEFEVAARNSVSRQGEYVVISHLYLQRKVTPLPIYFQEENDSAAIRQVVIDFGYFIKDLAATGLFPADLFNTWNYGVTEGNRVVLYDYDDVIPLENATFRRKPGAMDEYEEMNPEEDWIIAESTDFFVDEIDSFVGIPYALRGIFNSEHKDLFTMGFWENIKARVAEGEIIDIIAYGRDKRFRRITREA
ncbi:MAG: bifunctional isocitrate dehydrogenase kinase/phosphatase [Ignavibacteriales bacterium]|nr:bifunctional isocitrate dehydrogenase kinase/phosphatase [Ignavibacteriales bacterium]